MVKHGGTFNRNYVNKRKLIRDKKRAGIRRKKRRLGYDDKPEMPKTKKEIKQEKINESILKKVGMTAEEVHNLLTYRKERLRKRRRNQKKKRYIKQDNNNMDIEKNEEIKEEIIDEDKK